MDENFIDEEEVDEAIPRKAKHDLSPAAKAARKKRRRDDKGKNRGKIRRQRKKAARLMKSPAYKARKKQADRQGRTVGGLGPGKGPGKRKTTYSNRT